MYMYQFVSLISFIIRAGIYYLAIGTTPVFANESIEWIVGQIIPIHAILWLISYTTVGRGFGYNRGDDPVLGVVLYAIVYIPLILFLWGVLWLLTLVHILPI